MWIIKLRQSTRPVASIPHTMNKQSELVGYSTLCVEHNIRREEFLLENSLTFFQEKKTEQSWLEMSDAARVFAENTYMARLRYRRSCLTFWRNQVPIEQQIAELVSEGWVLQGPATVVKEKWSQTMVR